MFIHCFPGEASTRPSRCMQVQHFMPALSFACTASSSSLCFHWCLSTWRLSSFKSLQLVAPRRRPVFCTKACTDCDGGGLEGREVDKLNVYKAHLHHHFHIMPRLHRERKSVRPTSERDITTCRCTKDKLAHHVDQEKDAVGLEKRKGNSETPRACRRTY